MIRNPKKIHGREIKIEKEKREGERAMGYKKRKPKYSLETLSSREYSTDKNKKSISIKQEK